MSVHWLLLRLIPLPLAALALPMFYVSQSVSLLSSKFAGTSRPYLNLQLFEGGFAIYPSSLSLPL